MKRLFLFGFAVVCSFVFMGMPLKHAMAYDGSISVNGPAYVGGGFLLNISLSGSASDNNQVEVSITSNQNGRSYTMPGGNGHYNVPGGHSSLYVPLDGIPLGTYKVHLYSLSGQQCHYGSGPAEGTTCWTTPERDLTGDIVLNIVNSPTPTSSITITSPKNGTTWKKGTQKTVTWRSKGIPAGDMISGYLDTAFISISDKASHPPVPLFTNVSGNQATFTVPTTLSNSAGYSLVISATKPGAALADVANSNFVGIKIADVVSPTPKPKPAKAYNPIGYFDAVNCSVISGWTCDQNDFNTPLRVDVYSGAPAGRGNHVINDTANVKREAGVGARCGGNPAHGFNIPTPPQLKDNKTHDIYVYGINIGPGANKLLGHKKMGKCS